MGDAANFLGQYSYLGIIIALIGGLIGLPIPDEVLLTFVGYQVFLGKMIFLPSLLCALAGSIGGISLSYYLGAKLGEPFLTKFGPKLHISTAKIKRAKDYFSKYGPYLIFIGYFIPGFRHISAYLAGINQYPYKKFAGFAYIGALVWCFSFILLGSAIGSKWRFAAQYMERYSMIAVPVIVFLMFFCLIYSRKKRRESAKAKEIFE